MAEFRERERRLLKNYSGPIMLGEIPLMRSTGTLYSVNNVSERISAFHMALYKMGFVMREVETVLDK